MTKEEILNQLKNDTYCRLKRSPISGVGVFAIKRIPAGITPFGKAEDADFVEFKPEELDDLDPEVKRYVQDLCSLDKGSYYLPECGIQKIDISWYLNHSKEPNMTTGDDGANFIASRDIEVGEELTVDYETYNDPKDIMFRK